MPNGGQHDTRVTTRAACLAVNKAATANYRDLPPPDFSLSATSSNTIKLSMATPVSDADTYDIQRSMNGISWTTIDTLLTAAQLAEYLDGAKNAETKYYYQARAVNQHGKSKWSAIKSETTPAATVGALSGGNSALSWSLSEDAEDATLTITTDGTKNFGNLGPDLLYRMNLRSAINGQLTQADFEGIANMSASSGTLSYVEDASLPYGRGVPVEGFSTQYDPVNPTPSKRVYEHCAIRYPLARQETARAIFTDPAYSDNWQIKPVWHMNTADGHKNTDPLQGNDNNTCFFHTMFSQYNQAWDKGKALSSNSIGPTEYSGDIREADRTYIKTQTFFTRYLARIEDVAGDATTGGFIGHDLIDSQGLVTSSLRKQRVMASKISGTTDYGPTVVDRFTFPGYTRGFVADSGPLYSDLAVQHGDGAWARVELTDSADYMSSRKVALCNIETWYADTKRVDARVRAGTFYNDTLVGKHIHLHDKDGNHIYVGEIA